ncbi:MAG: hypothetical protein KDG51_10650 [Calditrichaeota bacterium]|nr:hypothetical protein [Calditrichota bacterium]
MINEKNFYSAAPHSYRAFEQFIFLNTINIYFIHRRERRERKEKQYLRVYLSATFATSAVRRMSLLTREALLQKQTFEIVQRREPSSGNPAALPDCEFIVQIHNSACSSSIHPLHFIIVSILNNINTSKARVSVM